MRRLDFKNVNKKRWKKTYKVMFDTFTFFSSIMIRFSGNGLTSVGNYFINWTVDTAIDSVAEAIMTRYDWSDTTISQFMDLPTFVEQRDVMPLI